MSNDPIHMADWLQALVAAAEELATTTLGLSSAEFKAEPCTLPASNSGSYIALVGDEATLQIGIAGSREACWGLARSMLGLEAGEELPEPDAIDALGEIANVLAGGVKRRMFERDASIKLGLPVVVNGNLRTTERTEQTAALVSFGAIPALLMVYRERGTALAPTP